MFSIAFFILYLQNPGAANSRLYNNRLLAHSDCAKRMKAIPMLDTVKLFTRDFDIAKTNTFQRQTVTAYDTGEYKAEKIYCNTAGGHFDIKQQGSEKCLFFQTSLPKLVYGNSLKELKQNDFDRCLQALRGQFAAAGAIVEKQAFETLPLSRLDYCRNIQVEHSIIDYLALLRNCSFGKRNRTNWKTETVLFFNGSQEFTAYNKVLEVKQNESQAAAAGVNSATPENVLRFESRLKKAEVVKRELHCRTFSECWNFELAQKKLLKDFDAIVQNVGQQLELNFKEDTERLLALREKSRYSWNLFIAEKGIPLFLIQYNYDLELIKKLLFEAYQRRQAYYILKQLKQFIAEHRTPEQRNLLEEVRCKLAA